jgi:hypothetical protein
MAPLLLTLLMVSPALLATLGIWLLSFSGLQSATAVAQGLYRRWSGRFAWLYDEDGATFELGTRRWTFTWSMLVPFVAGWGLAALWRQPVLSVWSALLGTATTVLIYLSAAPATAEERSLAEVFLAAFRSRYAVSHSLGAALQGAAEDVFGAEEHPLLRTVQQTVQRLYAGEELAQALQPLAAHSPLFRRLARILERSNLAAQDETQVLLEALEDLARQNRRLAERAQVTLTVVRLTLRILTVANATIISAAALLPTWRRHYIAQPATYMLGSSIALAGYGYFRFKIKHLQEQL